MDMYEDWIIAIKPPLTKYKISMMSLFLSVIMPPNSYGGVLRAAMAAAVVATG